MVEISKSGSGEGFGWATGRGYSTICIVVVMRISSPGSWGVKADVLQRIGRQQSWMRYGECPGYRRGLRAGHVSTG